MAHEDLLRLGAHLEVLWPIELRDHLARTAAEMLATYAGGAPGSGMVPGSSPIATG